MAATAGNIFAPLSGNPTANELLWVADAASAVLPTDSLTALDASFKSAGFIASDGATSSTSIGTTDVPSFGSFSPTLTLITSEVITVRFVAQETNKVTAAIESRQALSAVTVTSGAMATTRGPDRDALYAVVIDAVNGSNHVRDVYPSVRMTALGDQQLSFANPLLYDFTFTAYTDGNGNARYRYIKITGLT